MKAVVTGGAGFIGSNLVDDLISRGDQVVVVDNFTTGREEHLKPAEQSGQLKIERCDLFTEPERLPGLFAGADIIFHLAANADVRFGWNHPLRDMEQNAIATNNVLEAMRASDVPEIIFSSTGSVYGEAEVIPTPENVPTPVQTSLYGASKISAEGLISAYVEGCDIKATVFRFVSIMGPRYSHGHVIDFIAQLLSDPTKLKVLGDGNQRKSYLDVSDCVAAITARAGNAKGFEVFNLGCDSYCTVNDSIGWITSRMGVAPELIYSGGDRGWIGDNPFIFLDTAKIRSTGWAPKYSIQQAIERTVDFLVSNPLFVEEVQNQSTLAK